MVYQDGFGTWSVPSEDSEETIVASRTYAKQFWSSLSSMLWLEVRQGGGAVLCTILHPMLATFCRRPYTSFTLLEDANQSGHLSCMIWENSWIAFLVCVNLDMLCGKFCLAMIRPCNFDRMFFSTLASALIDLSHSCLLVAASGALEESTKISYIIAHNSFRTTSREMKFSMIVMRSIK